MTNFAEASAFDRIAELVTRRTGIVTTRAQTDIARATRDVIERVGLRNVAELENRLAAGAFWEEMLDQVTVRETYFFRNPEHFDLIRSTILPELRRIRPLTQRLNAWSAGCASGEELYSLAMLLHGCGLLDSAYLIGTDVAPRALATARAGRYREWSFRVIDPALVPRFFRQEQQEYVICDALRKRVTFAYQNLIDEPGSSANDGGRFDLILCRNVMIYFGTDSVARLERRLYDALAPGGWLVTGPSDPALGQHTPLEIVVLPFGVCYRRAAEPVVAPYARTRFDSRRPKSPLPVRPAHRLPSNDSASSEYVRERAVAFQRAEHAHAIEIAHPLPDDATLATLAALEVRATWNVDGANPAERMCTLALHRHPMSAELHYLHAMTLLESKRMQEALRAVRCALYLDRTLAIAHFAHGAILERLNDLEGARRAYRNTCDGCNKHQPDDAVAFGEGILAQGLCNAASHALKELAKRCPV